MPLYLIRHGESAGNVARVFQGQLDYPLTPLGEQQAARLGQWLVHQGVRPARILASPLLRAWRTAEILLEQFQGSSVKVQVEERRQDAAATEALEPRTVTSAPHPLKLDPAPELAEYHGGELQGLTTDEQEARFPGYLTRPLNMHGDFSAYGGESYDAVQARMERLLERLERPEYAGKDTLVVGHGGSLYQLLKLCCAWPVPRHFRAQLGNCCCIKVVPAWLGEQRLMQFEWMVNLQLIEASLAPPPRFADDPAVE